MVTHRCFDHSLSDSDLLAKVAAVTSNWPVPDFGHWSQCYDYFFGAHYALHQALKHEYHKLEKGSYYEREVRPILHKMARDGWDPCERKDKFNIWASGFYLNSAIDRIAEAADRLKIEREEIEKEKYVTLTKELDRFTDFPDEFVFKQAGGLEFYDYVHKYVWANPSLLRQDCNFRKHRTGSADKRPKKRENIVPSGWPKISPVLIRSGCAEHGAEPFTLEDDTYKTHTPLGCLRPQCLWRFVVSCLIELAECVKATREPSIS